MFKIKEHEAIAKIHKLQDGAIELKDQAGRMLEWLFENRDNTQQVKAEKPENSSQAVQQTQPIIPLPEECVFVPMADKLGIDINLAAKLYDAVVAKQQADG